MQPNTGLSCLERETRETTKEERKRESKRNRNENGENRGEEEVEERKKKGGKEEEKEPQYLAVDFRLSQPDSRGELGRLSQVG